MATVIQFIPQGRTQEIIFQAGKHIFHSAVAPQTLSVCDGEIQKYHDLQWADQKFAMLSKNALLLQIPRQLGISDTEVRQVCCKRDCIIFLEDSAALEIKNHLRLKGMWIF